MITPEHDPLLLSVIKRMMSEEPDRVLEAETDTPTGRQMVKVITQFSRAPLASDGAFNPPLSVYFLFENEQVAVTRDTHLTDYKMNFGDASDTVIVEHAPAQFDRCVPSWAPKGTKLDE